MINKLWPIPKLPERYLPCDVATGWACRPVSVFGHGKKCKESAAVYKGKGTTAFGPSDSLIVIAVGRMPFLLRQVQFVTLLAVVNNFRPVPKLAYTSLSFVIAASRAFHGCTLQYGPAASVPIQ